MIEVREILTVKQATNEISHLFIVILAKHNGLFSGFFLK